MPKHDSSSEVENRLALLPADFADRRRKNQRISTVSAGDKNQILKTLTETISC